MEVDGAVHSFPWLLSRGVENDVEGIAKRPGPIRSRESLMPPGAHQAYDAFCRDNSRN